MTVTKDLHFDRDSAMVHRVPLKMPLSYWASQEMASGPAPQPFSPGESRILRKAHYYGYDDDFDC